MKCEQGSVTMGCELEGIVRTTDGVDIKNRLRAAAGAVEYEGFGSVTTDFGPEQFELITRPTSSTAELMECLHYLEERLVELAGSDAVLKYVQYDDDFFYTLPRIMAHPAITSRHRAMIEAIVRETGGNHKVLHMGRICSLHLHTGYVDADSVQRSLCVGECQPLGLTLLNVLNNTAPYRAQVIANRIGVPLDRRRFRVFRDFPAAPRRPSNLWYTIESLERRVEDSGPQIVRQTKGMGKPKLAGEWEVDLETPSSLYSLLSSGYVWDFTRFSFSYGTVEDRVLPTMPVERAESVIEDHRQLSSLVLNYPDSGRIRTIREAEQLYRDLSRESGLIPEEPLTAVEWNGLLYGQY